MKQLILILILCLAGPGFGHDIRMAIFEISQQEGRYVLEVSLDKADLKKSLLTTYPLLRKSDDLDHKEHSIKDYLLNNFQLRINDECQEMTVEKIEYDKEFVRISIALPYEGPIKDIVVFNTCLIDYNPGHMNIFKAKLNDKVRTFNLNGERISTSFSY